MIRAIRRSRKRQKLNKVNLESHMRRSLIEEKEFKVSPSIKNYRSNKELEFYKTAPTYEREQESHVDNSSIESLAKEHLNRKI